MLYALACSAPAFAAHPLVTDDTGTQGAGVWQLEVNTDQNKQRVHQDQSRYATYNTTLTYGVTDHSDLAVTLPYQWQRLDGQPVQKGLSDILLEWKWVFYEKDGLSFAIKPAFLLPSGNQHDDLGNGKTGYGVTAISTFKTGKWTLLGNAEIQYADNTLGMRRQLWSASTAVLYQLTDSLQLVADTGIRRNPDSHDSRHPAFVLAGLIYSPNKTVDIDIGYKRGLNHAETDRDLAAGLTLHW